MILLKAIGKTLLSILKVLLIISVVIGAIIVAIFIGQHPTLVNITGNIFIVILLSILIFLIGSIIVMDIKDNYETFARKSTNAENTYRIHYNIVPERDRVVTGKTKRQAIENFHKEIRERKIGTQYNCTYKVTKVKEII